MSTESLFESVTSLPDSDVERRTSTLIGFSKRYEELRKDIRMLLAPDDVAKWSQQFHKKQLTLLGVLADRYPLIVFYGGVGNGKTATAEGVATRFAKETGREATLYKLSTRVRGSGLHGEMSKLVGDAFSQIENAIGKKRLAFLLIDEADALASSRENAQSHQEEKAGTNTLIQNLDDVRKLGGRLVVFLCTNRLTAVDPAIVRRAAKLISFPRPTASQREELLRADLGDIDLTDKQFAQLVEATGDKGRKLSLSFSDLRTRFLPGAVMAAFPDAPLTFDVLLATAKTTPPSPALENEIDQ